MSGTGKNRLAKVSLIVAGALLGLYITSGRIEQPDTEISRRLGAAGEEQEVPTEEEEEEKVEKKEVMRAKSKAEWEKKSREVPYELPQSAAAWCLPPTEPPLDYFQCEDDRVLAVAKIRAGSGMGSAVSTLLDLIIWAFANDFCFILDETDSGLRDRSQDESEFFGRYFEPIGLSRYHKYVQDSIESYLETGHPHMANFLLHNDVMRVVWGHHNITIPKLGFWNMDRSVLKKKIFARVFRFLPTERRMACSRLEKHGLKEEYVALSFRRGDKKFESHLPQDTPTHMYITEAERVIESNFDGKVPKFFVATDDCAVMDELRELRPKWTFISECDNEKVKDDGYYLADMTKWSQDHLDDHFHKFFVELIAMASAKVFIGVTYTNVSRVVYYMRTQSDDTFRLLRDDVSRWKRALRAIERPKNRRDLELDMESLQKDARVAVSVPVEDSDD